MVWLKALIVIFLLAMLYSLFSALVFLIKDQGKSSRTSTALSWRIGLSLLLFLIIIITIYSGFLTPHGIGG